MDEKSRKIDFVEDTKNRKKHKGNGKVAIIGIACRFPGADDYNTFWSNLRDGVASISEISDERWDVDKFYSTNIDEPNKINSKWMGQIKDPFRFDNSFFNISAREAMSMDPQQRILIEEAYHCIEDSGVPLNSLKERVTSIHVGAAGNDYGQYAYSMESETDSFANQGNYTCVLANRLSYIFGFCGKSIAIDAACASSLVALNDATRSVENFESDYAVAAGVSLALHPRRYISMSGSRMLSPDGVCRTFDKDANGFVPGEGVGVLLLQRLEDAIKDGNHIYGVIKGSAVNHGGRAKSITAPRVEAQKSVILAAYNDAGTSPDTITYIEAHGTGTSLGDPIEIEAQTQAFREYTADRQFCMIGSVKTNIGHLEAAAGMAGVIKVLMMMKHQQIPPSLNMNTLNPIIDFRNSPFTVATKLSNWLPRKKNLPLRAGVSAFGFGGVNCHFIIEQYKKNQKVNTQDENYDQIFALSANKSESLERLLEKWKIFVKSPEFLKMQIPDITYTLLTGRESHDVRIGGIVRSRKEMLDIIEKANKDHFVKKMKKPLCLRLGDVNIGGFLHNLRRFPIFDSILEEQLEILGSNSSNGQDIAKGIYEDEWNEEYTELYSFIIQNSIVRTIMKLGVKPDLILAYGNGVWAGLAAANILKYDEIIKILCKKEYLDSVIPRRPAIPFYNQADGTILSPFYFKEDYLKFLLDDVEITSKTLGRMVVEGIYRDNEDPVNTRKSQDIRIGAILLRKESLTEEQLKESVKEQALTGELLGEVTIRKGFCTPVDIYEALRLQSAMHEKIDNVLIYYIDKASKLNESQFTFKKYLEEWNKVLLKSGLDIGKMLDDSSYFHKSDENTNRKKLLLLIIILSSLKHLSTKWDLTEQQLIEEKKFYELLNLVYDEVISKEGIVNLIMNRESAFEDVLKEMNSNYKKMDSRYSYEYAREFNRKLTQIGTFKDWIESISNNASSNELENEYELYDLGSIGTCSDKDYDKYIQAASIERMLLDLWLKGIDIKWDEMFHHAMGRKTPLPVYPFGGERFMLRKPENPLKCGHSEYAEKPLTGIMEAEHYEKPCTAIFGGNWERKDISIAVEGINTSENYLVFDTQDAIFEGIKQIINSHRTKKGSVYHVKNGSAFNRISADVFEINPMELDNYIMLFETLHLEVGIPQNIIQTYPFKSAGYAENGQGDAFEEGIFPLFNMCKAILMKRLEKKTKLLTVFENINEERPEWSAINGFARTVSLENPYLKIKTCELCDRGSLLNSNNILELIAKEIEHDENEEFQVRYLSGIRYVKRFRQVIPNTGVDKNHLFKNGGVYLITGGAGGIGLAFAEYIAQRYRATIILTGRSELNDKKKSKLEGIKSKGCDVIYIKSDISRKEDVKVLVSKIKSMYHKIDGVIHSAGIYVSGFLIKKEKQDLEKVLAPKAYGAINIDEELKNEKLDFFALFSSLSSICGKVGQSDYSYANCFLDGFAERRNKLVGEGKRHGKTISFNWPYWKDGGMQISQEDCEYYSEKGIEVLTSQNGTEAMETAFTANLSQCAVIYGYGNKAEDFLNFVTGKQELCDDELFDSERLTSMTKSFLAELIAGELKISTDKMDCQAGFYEYGIDSLIINHFNSKMEKLLGSLPKTLLYEYNSINELTEYFVQNHKLLLQKYFSGLKHEKERRKNTQPPQAYSTLTVSETEIDNTRCTGNDIAVIGMAGRFPGAADIEGFWDNLKAGKDSIVEIPADRWDYRKFYNPNMEELQDGEIYCKWGGFIDNACMFEPLFFGISPKEAEMTDPQERIFLETAWAAFEDAGYTRERLKRECGKGNSANVGVFAGVTSNTYQLNTPDEWNKGNMVFANSFPWSIANRVSYCLNLNGPSLAVDTACSSGLQAVHLAYNSLINGECEMAIAGGVNLYLHHSKYAYMCKLKMLSPTGKCHAFGEDSDGFVPGEGVGAILLKPLEKAKKDGDRIYCVIKGSATNHGGTTSGYTVPNPNEQASLILDAIQRAGVDARCISYVEAHGTGTRLGDPIEIRGLTKAYRNFTQDRQYCSIGSVKSNIGHLESAAGIVGIVKIILQMKHRQLVPSLHAQNINTSIGIEDTPFYVQKTLSSWEKPVCKIDGVEKQYPRTAAISGFGAGGSNVHLIIEEYENSSEPVRITEDKPAIIVLSARNENRLKFYVENMLDFIRKRFNGQDTGKEVIKLTDIAYTLQVGREPMNSRIAFVVESIGGLLDSFQAYLSDNQLPSGVFKGQGRGCLSDSLEGRNISDLITRKDMELVARMWVEGAEIAWEGFYTKEKPCIVSLPTYPFDRERYFAGSDEDFSDNDHKILEEDRIMELLRKLENGEMGLDEVERLMEGIADV